MDGGALIKRIRTSEEGVGSHTAPSTIDLTNNDAGSAGGLFTTDVAILRQRKLAEAREAKLGKPNSIPLWLQFVDTEQQMRWRQGLPVEMTPAQKAKYDNFRSAVIFPRKTSGKKRRVTRRKTTTRRKKAPARRRAAPRSRAGMAGGVTIVKG